MKTAEEIKNLIVEKLADINNKINESYEQESKGSVDNVSFAILLGRRDAYQELLEELI